MLHTNLPIVIFSLPYQKDCTLLSGKEIAEEKVDREFTGFVFHPFQTKEDKAIFIKQEMFENIRIADLDKFDSHFKSPDFKSLERNSSERQEFVLLVEEMKRELEQKNISKTVASRVKVLERSIEYY